MKISGLYSSKSLQPLQVQHVAEVMEEELRKRIVSEIHSEVSRRGGPSGDRERALRAGLLEAVKIISSSS